MPSLGADMVAGTLIGWRVKPGDTVRRGQIVAEVSTDKGDIEVEIFSDGMIERLMVQPGERVPVGTVLAELRDGATTDEPRAPAPQVTRASPLARKIAASLGVDLASVSGTGPEGAITRADVERAGEAAPAVPPSLSATPRGGPAPVDAAAGVRRAIAAAMARSNREIPHYYLETGVDMSRALAWLADENMRRPVERRLLPVALVLRAVVRALAAVPELNGYWVDGRHQQFEAVHVGFAVSLRNGGLVVPALLDAHRQSVDEVMASLHDLITRARAGRLRSSELSDATITVTSLGDLGVEKVFGVIYPPQVALVGFGRIMDRPMVDEGTVAVRPHLSATLAADHRATDGRRGGQFLGALVRALEEPATL